MTIKETVEAFAQKIAQLQDSGDIFRLKKGYGLGKSKRKKEPKHEVININNYERYWDDSTPNGHQIRIVKTDNSTIEINLEWPKGRNPRMHSLTKRYK
jgi:hypothetical protein